MIPSDAVNSGIWPRLAKKGAALSRPVFFSNASGAGGRWLKSSRPD